jgi:hypothetical protein
MIKPGFNYLHYNDDGSLDEERTSEAFLDYMEALSEEGSSPVTLGDNEKASVYVVLTTPSSSHWYEKTIAGVQGSNYSHTGITFDSKMSTLYHVRSKGLIVTKRREFTKEKIGIDLYEYEVTLKEKRKMQNLVRHMINIKTKYDFLMIGKLLGKIIFRKKDKEGDKKVTPDEIVEKQKYICSGWVAGILAAAVPKFRNYLWKTKKKWHSFMPEDFVRVKCLVFKKRIIFPENKVFVNFDK